MIDGSNKTGSLNKVLELVRLSASNRTNRGTARHSEPPAPSARMSRDLTVLKARLSEQVDSVDVGDDEAVRKARKAILREILAWEFGDNIRNHPEFTLMTDAVETAMTGNDKTRERFDAVIRDLRKR